MRLVLLALLLSGCATKDLKWQVAVLDAKVTVLNQRMASVEAGNGIVAELPANEAEAANLLEEANTALSKYEFEKAKSLAKQIQDEFSNTNTAKRARSILDELSVIGVEAGGYEVQQWIQGTAEPGANKITVLVFFEEWCPHCKREVPELQKKSVEWAERDIGLVGFTRLTRSSTLENTQDLLKKHKVTYPVAIETGAIAERFNVSGIPAAAIVANGKAVWRGHPGRITDSLINAIEEQQAKEASN
jgi:thiol-disulfide isomerase/thioredoxin